MWVSTQVRSWASDLSGGIAHGSLLIAAEMVLYHTVYCVSENQVAFSTCNERWCYVLL